MCNQFHKNTKCIYILHTQYFELLKLHQNMITPRFLKPIPQPCFFLFTLGWAVASWLHLTINGANRNGWQRTQIIMISGHFSLHCPWDAEKPVAMTSDINIFQLWKLFHYCMKVTILKWKCSSEKIRSIANFKFLFHDRSS